MKPLINCLKLHKIDSTNESAIKILLKELNESGYTGHQAEVFAVDGYLDTLRNEQANIFDKAKNITPAPQEKNTKQLENNDFQPEEEINFRQDEILELQEQLKQNREAQENAEISELEREDLGLDEEDLLEQIIGHKDAIEELKANLDIREKQTPGQGLQVKDIQKIFPEQDVFIGKDGTISVHLKNGQGIIFKNVKNAGKGFIEFAIQTGQMSKNGKILGATIGNKIILDSEYADNQTLWHENKHVLDNLGIITEEDDSALNREFNKLYKENKINFDLSTHKDPIKRMIENRAKTFAQIMTNRAKYRDTTFNKIIQKVMDFFNQIYTVGRRIVSKNKNFQTTSNLAREAESGKLYERPGNDAIQSTEPQLLSIPINEKDLPIQVKDLLNLPYWKKIKSLGQLYRNKEFFDKTGFWAAKDGKWRYEIDDSKAELTGVAPSNFIKTAKLPQIIKHENLYETFPQLKNIKVHGGEASGRGVYFSAENVVRISNDDIKQSPKKAKKVLLHEIQHMINNETGGFAGTNIRKEKIKIENQLVINKLKKILTKLKDPDAIIGVKDEIDHIEKFPEDIIYPSSGKWLNKTLTPYFIKIGEIEAAKIARFPLGKIYAQTAYKENPGEMEARLTETRMNMTAKERKAEPPWITLDKMLEKEDLKDADYLREDGDPFYDPGQALFETREPLPKQKISDEQYNKMYNQKKNIIEKLQQSTRIKASEAKLILDKSLTPISTRLKNMGLEDLSNKLRLLDFRTAMKITKALEVAHPMMKKAKKKMSSNDRLAWDSARKNSDLGKIIRIARKYGIEENYNALREVLNTIRQDAIDVGLKVGFIEDYWPRIIKDREGFLQATQNISRDPVFTKAFKRKADELGITTNELEQKYPDLKADIISNIILGVTPGIGGPGNIKGRVFETIPEEYAEFYMDSDAALMQYIYSMTKKIEARRFFGKVPQHISRIKQKRNLAQTELIKLEKLEALESSELPNEEQQKLIDAHRKRIELLQENVKDYNKKLEDYKNQRDYTENIGAYINDLMISGKLNKKDEQAVRDILDARFHERGTTGIVHFYKNMEYVDVMGNPLAAVTQVGDAAWAMYVGEVWNPLRLPMNVKNLTKAIFKKSNITKEDLGIERMAQEFADFDSMSRVVSKVFKYTGLEKIDSIGKEFLINNAFDMYKRQASTKEGRIKLMKKLRPIFGMQSNKVINDLLSNTPSENVKMLLYSRLLDFQPVALSEMPEYYLKGGNWRILYMLKTFTIKQFDVFRNEVWRDLKTGDAKQKLGAMKRMVQLMGVLALANAGADEIKDFMLGKETRFRDIVIENFLSMGGANRFVRMQARREGIGTAIGQLVFPPFKLANSLSKDVLTGEIIDPEKSRLLESLPFIGKLLYWHVGRGSEYRPSIEEQDFKDAGKSFRKFKKSFDEAKDKRFFLKANEEEFKQAEIYNNFNTSIRNITTLINKLKKAEQTTNVRKRIGQLTEARKQIRQKYFIVTDNL